MSFDISFDAAAFDVGVVEPGMVPPPATNFWNHEYLVSKALEVLRLGVADADVQRVRDAADAATDLIDANLDNLEPVYPTSAKNTAAIQVTVELYRRKDAPFGVVDAWSADTVAYRISGDPLAGVAQILLPAKTRWGIG